ncbi:MAG: NAD(P)/FAD-dependent oxidoreductase [Firmicutes bacterium]|nr:NAD(P)/FAD-dependent oxidoreductase [Bacillota bacterium]
MDKSKIAVIGAGASGLMAAAFIKNADVTVYDGNGFAGKKLAITGGGRCNLTNLCGVSEFLAHVVRSPKFLYSSLSAFAPKDTMSFFENLGVQLKVEDEGRVFPVSDKAADIVNALYDLCVSRGVCFEWRPVLKIEAENGRVTGIALSDGVRGFDRVIIASGGAVHRSLGSNGDGYRFAEALGIKVNEPLPSLFPLGVCEKTEREQISALAGISLHDVSLNLLCGESKKPLYSGRGGMMFTHTGITGPLALCASAHIAWGKTHRVRLNFLPDMKKDELDAYLSDMFQKNGTRNVHSLIKELCPSALASLILRRAGARPDMKCCEASREMRVRAANELTGFELEVSGKSSFDSAMITRGGVDVSEVSPKKMESKRVAGLYFCGEVLDVDAYTGGYNLQIAFSTGHAAGISACGAE